MSVRRQIGVIGAADAGGELSAAAEEMGRLVASRGWTLICGGLSGVMESASRGAKAAGGLTVGILPGPDRDAANPYIDVSLPTNLGQARNAVIAQAADALVAVGGGWGTLSEIALARKMGKPVVALGSWDLGPEIRRAATPSEAVELLERVLNAAGNPQKGR